MNNLRLLQADNHYHLGSDRPLAPSSGLSNEFDYDDPDFSDLYGPSDDPTDAPTLDEGSLRCIRDFILSCSLYVADLEAALEQQSLDFWEDREHAYRLLTELLIDTYELERGP